jgi:branched-chain amino acid transport system permease protein
MIDFVQTSIDGVLIGASYALIAIGFALTYGVVKRINLAYGSCLLFGAALAVFAETIFHFGPIGMLAVTILGAVVASLYVEWLCFASFKGQHAAVTSMVASFAIWMQLDEVSAKLLPQRTHDYTGFVYESWEIGPFILRAEQIPQLLIAPVVLLIVFTLIRRTRLGLHLTALSENRKLAIQIGINTRLVAAVFFAIAAFVGSVGTFLLLSSDGQVTPLFGLWSLFKGLVAVMIGGLGSLGGAVLGALLLGFVETHAAYAFGAEYRDITTFGLLFLFLILKPSGLLGAKNYQRDVLEERRI